MNSTPEITIDITSPEGATENDIAMTAVMNAIKPAIVRIVAEAIKQAAGIEREACAQAIEDESHEHPGAEFHYSIAAGVVRARGSK